MAERGELERPSEQGEVLAGTALPDLGFEPLKRSLQFGWNPAVRGSFTRGWFDRGSRCGLSSGHVRAPPKAKARACALAFIVLEWQAAASSCGFTAVR